jgi:hypothetical protein
MTIKKLIEKLQAVETKAEIVWIAICVSLAAWALWLFWIDVEY